MNILQCIICQSLLSTPIFIWSYALSHVKFSWPRRLQHIFSCRCTPWDTHRHPYSVECGPGCGISGSILQERDIILSPGTRDFCQHLPRFFTHFLQNGLCLLSSGGRRKIKRGKDRRHLFLKTPTLQVKCWVVKPRREVGCFLVLGVATVLRCQAQDSPS